MEARVTWLELNLYLSIFLLTLLFAGICRETMTIKAAERRTLQGQRTFPLQFQANRQACSHRL